MTTAPVGAELKIRYFLPGFQQDGHQWVAVWYNVHKGFSQIDTLGYYSVVQTSTSLYNPETGFVQADVKTWHYFVAD